MGPQAADASEDWAGFFERAPCGLLRLDAGHVVRVANPYALELLGRTGADIGDGLPFNTLLSVAGRVFVQTQLWAELALAGRVEERTLDLVRPDGERTPVLLNAVQVRDADGAPGDIKISLTRAAVKRAYEAEIPRARHLAEQAAQAKSDFLANVSHEIRTPLNGMVGVAGALGRTPLSASQAEMVALIQSSGAMLERLLSDVLELSKVEAGGLQLEPQPFDLQRELNGALELARIRADAKGLCFDARFGPEADGRFFGDAVRLKQILGNLTANAVKFTEGGEVRVRVELDPAGPDPVLSLTVEDTGIGFDQATGDTLFQRFQQADAGITRRFGGTGLGLAICKALVDLMGGTIKARSQPGRGSRFQVRVPLPRCETEAPAEAPAAAAEPAADRPLRILLVEDHPTNRKVVELILAPYDIALVNAEDGRQGVDAWRAAPFDLVLMDMQMPVMDGLSAVREIRELERADPARPRTPIAMLSANAMEHHRRESLDSGADLHIAKPVTPDSLLAGIAAALEPQAEAAAA